MNERLFDHVGKNQIKYVLLINRWVYYTGSKSRPSEINLISRNPTGIVNKESSRSDFEWAVKNTVEQWGRIGVEVLFIEDNPQQLHEPKDILRKGRAVEENDIKFSVEYKDHIENQALVNSILRGQSAISINFDDILCVKDRCPLSLRSRFLYSDDDHLSIDGARSISPKLSIELEKILN